MHKSSDEKTLEEKLLDAWIIDDIVKDDNGNITHIYLRDNLYELVACLTYPHQGNQNKFMLRVETIYNFDRWDNVSCEVFFDNENDIPINPSEVWELYKIDDWEYQEFSYWMSEIEDDYIG